MKREADGIIEDVNNVLAKVLKDEGLALEYTQLHKDWIAHTRRYVDRHIGFAKTANTRSNDNSKEINRFLIGNTDVQNLHKKINLLTTANNQQANLLKEMVNRIYELEKPWWNKLRWKTDKSRPSKKS